MAAWSEPGLWLLLLPFGGAIVSPLLGLASRRLRNGFVGLAALGTLALGLLALLRLDGGRLALVSLPQYHIIFRLDPLSALMATLISLLGAAAAFFSFRYMEHYPRLNQYYALLMLFLGAMIGAVLAGELFTMFVLWELMTLAAFFLVIFDERPESMAAGIKYLVMSEAGALAMLAGMILIQQLAGITDILELKRTRALADPWLASMLWLFLLGLGVKAGMAPLHTWLPDAHPAAPSPISALLSGVMIKVGLFWMLRIFFEMLPPILTWQLVLGLLGAGTILVGGLVALVQTDIKRLIAYSSVSQVGYIILGLGLATSLGTAGALYHLVNHALFKGLLFLGAGAIIYRCGTRNLEELGGLARRMPLTFACFLIAALSLAGVPPLGGFYSKWMIYQALVESKLAIAPLLLGAALAGTALTLAYILKVVFAAFFGEETAASRDAREVGPTMAIPLGLLAALCIHLGVYPAWPIRHLIEPAVGWFRLVGVWNAPLATGLLLLGLAVGLLVYLFPRAIKLRPVPLFLGGESMAGEDTRVRGTEIYGSLMSLTALAKLYHQQSLGKLDIYNITRGIRGGLTKALRWAHSGLLPNYVAWVAVGLIVLLFLILGGGPR
ncbi:MAG: NADH-quinone oxidoreductase subunit M [Candidatus Acetothermia bacterium]|jgi:multicomponent Na+:H+ antiporter subunit D|nr:NADH-quinone oxidoreductase subunit M [Candidatus Acetothermia bacterium]MDH7504759.1 NADH-quinone oxidoreductase subunit M [Candidatus Acetothermia bacterium]